MAEEMVRVINRSTKGPVEWTYDSKLYVLATHGAKDEKGKPADRKVMAREAAFMGVKRLPITQDRFTGLTTTSFLGIEELDGEPSDFPSTPLDLHPTTVVDPKRGFTHADTDKTGQPVLKTVIDKDSEKPVPVKQQVEKIVGLSG